MSIWQIVRNVHLIFVEKAEIVHFAILPLYKRQKVWYNKSVVAKQEGGATSSFLQSKRAQRLCVIALSFVL